MSRKPSLKLKFGSSTSATPAPEQAPPAHVPQSATSSTTPKIKLTFGSKRKVTPQPADTQATPAKPGRKPKPTSKKRAAEEAAQQDVAAGESDADEPVDRQPKRIKLTARAPSMPFLKIRAKGKPPPRPLGVGYDSEASDREEDPTITENLILRMQPGDDCDYLRKAVNERNWGPVREGGADVRMRFLTKDARRGVLVIRGKMYAFVLVDLPCIIEAMKSWEKKAWWKSADVAQMLLVLGTCKNDEEAMTYPLPHRPGELNPKTWQYAHGITPPLRWVRKRRFRKHTVDPHAVEEVEKEVQRLLKADDECVGQSTFKLYKDTEDYDRQNSQMETSDPEDDEDEEEQGLDAEGEDVDDDGGLAAEMEAALAAHADEEEAAAAAAATPASADIPAVPTAAPAQSPPSSAVQSSAISQVQAADSPAAATTTSEEDEEDESDEDEDEAEVDEDALEAEQELKRQREEIDDLMKAITTEKERLEQTKMAMLKKKIIARINDLESNLDMKKRALGEGDGDE